MKKNSGAYKSIGEVAKILDLKNKKSGKFNTHTIRFWEKEFSNIKPLILSGKRRYYDEKSIQILKKIKFLLKNQGMTIKGVKKLLENKNSLHLDEPLNKTININEKNLILKNKVNKISKLIKEIKELK